MAQLRLVLRLGLLATTVCSYDGVWAMPQNREISKVFERASSPVDVPYHGSIPNLLLSARMFISQEKASRSECEAVASVGYTNFWIFNSGKCYMGFSAPVCRVEDANESDYMIKESFLTDGSPDDEPISEYGREQLMRSEPNIAFRVMTPTILDFPEFTTEIGFHSLEARIESDLCGKIFVFPKLGGVAATDDSILVDPSCHTNNACGVAFLTTSVGAVTAPHVALDEYCGQTIDLNDTPVLNVFSHAGIGCEFFPDVYPTPNCELTITSTSAITAKVTLVNFRKTTCEGYELKFITFPSEGVSKEVDVCEENTPTVFDSSEGKMQVKLTGSATENRQRYGFIIRLEKVTENDNSNQCSSENSVQGTTDDFPQVSTTAPDESPTTSTVQNPTDESDENWPEASLGSSSVTEFIIDPTESFVSESPSVSPKRPTNSLLLHLLLALGIKL